ncbi:hypothetical protein [Plantactinospora sp. WMMB782]|uniref:hypothetical protein n=1 Tax=Plantactinospora sp. WMMB782 TaxID=3404121 RepID=UPI003B953E05
MKRRTPAFDHVVYLYRTWASQRSGVWSKKEAWGDLRSDVIGFLRATSAPDDWDQLAEMLFNLADDAIVKAGEYEIRDADPMQQELPFALPYDLDAILALGAGDRCAFGDMRMAEWVRHDAKKYENMRAVQEAYDEWRQKSNHLLPGLTQGMSIREICERAAA